VHFKGIFSLGLVLVASVALVSASGGGTTAAKSGTRIDVSTRASIVHYLRSIHVNPKGVVIQRGLRNYAGPSCPGRAWRCARTQHAVVQIARPGGMNRFLCRTARCAVLQVAAAASRNRATCIKTTGLGASCSITQSNSAGNTALIWEDAGKLTGLTQTAVYSASIVQQSASGANLACVHQSIFIDGSTTNTRSAGATVTLEAHQSIFVKQDSTSGSNTAENAANPSTGVYTCASTAMSQDQKLTSTATSKGVVTQNENAAQSPCPDGVSGDNANMCLDIEQNQSTGFKGSASGANSATFLQTNSLSATANSPTGVSQTQSSVNPSGPGGGLVGTVNQDSSGLSTATATQSETQCEDAAKTGLTKDQCDPSDPDFAEAPSSLTQNQYGPVGLAKFSHKRRGRHFYKTLKGLGTATQTGSPPNSGDTFTINQSSTQNNDQGSGSTQTNTVQGDCSTPGNCTDTQTTNINGSTTTTTQSGQDVNTSTNCTGSTCQTTTPPPEIVGNNAAFGGGSIQTYEFATGALVNSFVPDGATATNANGRAVMVVGNEVFYTELSDPGFGPSDGIHVAPFNNGAGGSDLRVLPNPASSTGIQDLAYAGGYLYALTGYNQSPLQVWKLDPLTGSVIGGPISISGPDSGADGFTVLPDGNFLINDGDGSCTYREYKPSTGLATGTPLSVPGDPSICTGVETDGASLYFQTNFDSFTKTGLNGTLISTTPVASNSIEDISLA